MNPTLKIFLLGLALTAAATSHAKELGRLFFTPEQRAQLESGRQENAPHDDRSITVNGIVQKRGGGRIVWINNVPQPAGNSDERAPESVPVAVPGQTQPLKVKVGQKVLIAPAPSAQP